MKINPINRKDIHYYSKTHLTMSDDQNSLTDLIGLPFSKENIEKQIHLKQNQFSTENRKVLKNVLENQYAQLNPHKSVESNIEKITDRTTFTITTGQQLTLFGGPAFLFYKICHTISLCQKLNEIYPDNHFIPVFWLASEDHDKEEISEVNIFNKTLRWENNFSGATGKYPLDDNFESIKNEFSNFFTSSEFNEIFSHLSNFEGKTLSHGYISFLNSIFQQYGLIIIDANCEELKKSFISVFENEIRNFTTFENVNETNELLINKGIKPQAKIQDINFFRLIQNDRIKIKHVNGDFHIGEKIFNKEELIKEIHENPTSFSPNVFLRPLYQEMILPNLGYIGGPAELNYWLQLKSNFDANNIPFPLLINRLSVFCIDANTTKKIEKLNFTTLDFINHSTIDLQKKYLDNNEDLREINWESSDKNLVSSYEKALEIYTKQAPELVKSLDAEWNSIEKSFERIKTKIHKHIKQKNELELNQIEQVRNKIMPNGIQQERYYHFFQFCTDGSLSFMHDLIETIDPFSTDVLIIHKE